MAVEYIAVNEAHEDLRRAGFEHTSVVQGDTYRDLSTVLLCPTRGGKAKDYKRPDGEKAQPIAMLPLPVHQSIMSLVRPANHRWAHKAVTGDEVGAAYNRGIAQILAHPILSTFTYILTHEDDNILPPSALLCLIQTIERGGYDAVAGLYHMKSPLAIPMAFGRPGVVDGSGNMDFTARDLTDALLASNLVSNGEEVSVDDCVVEVNGIACGCTLWRMDLFRDLEHPWFQTFTRFQSNDVIEAMTQDIDFCKKAREKGKRFAVDCRVRVGHLDCETGQVY